MIHKVRLTEKSQRELEEAAIWWAEHRSQEQAHRWYQGFVEALSLLSRHPERKPLAREHGALPIELRELRYGVGKKPTHRAVFAIGREGVTVHAIRHLAQADLTPDAL